MEKMRLLGLWVGCLGGGAVHRAETRGGATGVAAVVNGEHNIEHGV